MGRRDFLDPATHPAAPDQAPATRAYRRGSRWNPPRHDVPVNWPSRCSWPPPASAFCGPPIGIAGFEALSSPGAVPMAPTAIMVVACADAVLVSTARRQPNKTRDAAPAILPMSVVVAIVLIAVYAVLLRPLGFIPTSLLFLTVLVWFLSRRSVLFCLAVVVRHGAADLADLPHGLLGPDAAGHRPRGPHRLFPPVAVLGPAHGYPAEPADVADRTWTFWP